MDNAELSIWKSHYPPKKKKKTFKWYISKKILEAYN